jgi:MerR family transcriptional regulator, light-induced transcriptional regulator
MFTIKRAAALTGVPEHTLRAWERRYALLEPARTDAGYRQYSSEDLTRIQTMRGLVEAGWSASRAAAEVARRLKVGAIADPFAELMAAASALDPERISRELKAQFAGAEFEAVLDNWLMPAMTRLGVAWANGEVSVAGEHLVANQVMRHFAAAYEDARPNLVGDPVLIGAPEGVEHQLGIFAFAVACRRRGLPTIFLGARVPLTDWLDAAQRANPRAVVTTAPRHRDVAKVSLMVKELDAVGVPIWVGGRFQHLIEPPAHQLGHRIGAAAGKLADDLQVGGHELAHDRARASTGTS